MPLLHRDRSDPRVFVPKEGGGVTLNTAHPIAWGILVSMTIVPVAVVVIFMVAALR